MIFRIGYFQVLQRILMGTDVVKNVNKNNASHAVLFEALALVSNLYETLLALRSIIFTFKIKLLVRLFELAN